MQNEVRSYTSKKNSDHRKQGVPKETLTQNWEPNRISGSSAWIQVRETALSSLHSHGTTFAPLPIALSAPAQIKMASGSWEGFSNELQIYLVKNSSLTYSKNLMLQNKYKS